VSEDGKIADLAAERDRKRRATGGAGAGGSSGRKLILDPRHPDDIAGKFLAGCHTDAAGRKTLLHHAGLFYRWEGPGWEVLEPAQLRAAIYAYLRAAWRETAKGDIEEFGATRSVVADILDALAARVQLDARVAAPAWLDEKPADLDASDILACRNVLLHLLTESRLLHTPSLFTVNAVDFDYDPEAACPRWRAFLEEVLPADAEAVDQLQQMAGYLLTPDTRQQKAFLLLGPPRSGKGTIGRVLKALIGARNVVAPGLSSLATTFGAEQLINMRLALISDARLGHWVDDQTIIEWMLRVTGEDQVTIQRKFLPAWSGQLPLRFVMLSNSLPNFMDSGGAFAGRWIILRFAQSFVGREDETLTDALLAELPGILNWALGGLAKLRAARRFAQPSSSAGLVQRWVDLVNPMAAFLRQECVIAPVAEIDKEQLWQAWRDWCADQGLGKPGSKASFGKALIAEVPTLVNKRSPRQYHEITGAPLPRGRLYGGLRLKEETERDDREDAG
jgi:putative DNA primase/helicase